ncbi:hypothetical protein B4Q13_17405, partial [Lacticaseibacillus rhamnosus]
MVRTLAPELAGSAPGALRAARLPDLRLVITLGEASHEGCVRFADALAAGMFLRRHYLAPLVTSKPNVSATAWITSQSGTKGGKFAFAGRPPINLLQQFCPPSAVGPGKPSSGNLAQCLSQH